MTVVVSVKWRLGELLYKNDWKTVLHRPLIHVQVYSFRQLHLVIHRNLDAVTCALILQLHGFLNAGLFELFVVGFSDGLYSRLMVSNGINDGFLVYDLLLQNLFDEIVFVAHVQHSLELYFVNDAFAFYSGIVPSSVTAKQFLFAHHLACAT